MKSVSGLCRMLSVMKQAHLLDVFEDLGGSKSVNTGRTGAGHSEKSVSPRRAGDF